MYPFFCLYNLDYIRPQTDIQHLNNTYITILERVIINNNSKDNTSRKDFQPLQGFLGFTDTGSDTKHS